MDTSPTGLSDKPGSFHCHHFQYSAATEAEPIWIRLETAA